MTTPTAPIVPTPSRWHSITGSPVFRLLLGVIVSGLTIYLAINTVTLDDLVVAFGSAQLLWVSLALLSVAINTGAKAIRWKVLLGPVGKPIRLWDYLAVLLIGQMLNTLIPARVGDLSRAYMIGSMGPGRVFTFGTVVIEKFLDMVAYALLFGLLLLLIPLPDWVRSPATGLAVAGVVVVLVLIGVVIGRGGIERGLTWLLHWLPARIRTRLLGFAERGLASVEVLRQRADLLRLIGWTLVVWGTAVLTNYLVLLALDLHLPLAASILLLVVLQAGIALPSVPGKIGVFEYSCILVLALYGVAQPLALSYGILLHTIVLVPTTLIGVVLFWQRGLSVAQLQTASTSPEATPSNPTPASPQEQTTP